MTHVESFLSEGPFVGLLLHDAIDAARCDEVLADVTRRGFDATGEHYPRTYRNNDRLVFDDAGLATRLFDTVRERLPAELVVDGVRWTLHGLNTRFRACRYHDGQAFCVHRDGPHVPSDDVRSHLTLQLYLDDVEATAGGRTRFYADASGSTELASIAPRRGNAIVFDHRVWHDGEAVTTGVKHVLRTDVMYRRAGHAASPGRDVLGRHRGYAWRVVACRDGSIASSGRDGTVRRWGRMPRTYDLGAGSVTTLVEDARGRLWAGTRGGTVAVEGADTFTIVATDVGAVLGGCAVDDEVVLATSRGSLVRAGEHAVVHQGWTWAVVPYGADLASCGDDGRVVLSRPGAPARTFAELATSLRALAVLGRDLLVGDTRGWLYRLGPEGDITASWRAHTAAITAIAVTPEGGWVTSSEDSRVLRWRGGQVVSTARAPDFVASVAVSRDGAIVCADYDGAIWVAL